jgi:hypothetical protein
LNSNTTGLRHEHLNQAGKLSRTFAILLDARNRHRGKGAQKITVEHVHVHTHTGGQAIVGSVSQSGGGRDNDENRGQPHDQLGPKTIFAAR